jgi:transcription initiation factor TFIIH subunit 3
MGPLIYMDFRLQRVDIWNVHVFRLEQELSAGTKMNSRILVVTGSADSASQYMNYMNVFFTAQKQVTTL